MSRVLPILFNSDMVRAILEGRKTVTRRVIKPQPTYDIHIGFSWKGSAYGTDLPPTLRGAAYNFKCAAQYQLGDILYVRETWGDYRECQDGGCGYYMYRADYPDGATTYLHGDGIVCDLPKWRPSIHMPKEAARIWLKVTDVRVERLQDITDEQAQKEGCTGEFTGTGEAVGTGWNVTPTEEFVGLWNSTIKKSDLDRYGWEASPWVWVIDFERCEKPDIVD